MKIKLESFNSDNLKHQKGIIKYLKKEIKNKPEISGVLMSKKFYKLLRKIFKNCI